MDLPAAPTWQGQPASRPPWEVSSVMPPLAALKTAASDARAFVRSALELWELSHLADTTAAIVSELVANAVNASTDDHGRPRYHDGRILLVWVRLHADEAGLKAEVWDQAPGVPVLQDVHNDSESGRGLTMVNALSGTWGWHPAATPPGKCVWARISIAP
jgi:anti-sigma regulatory factor (Ser/Thr protein kinase)